MSICLFALPQNVFIHSNSIQCICRLSISSPGVIDHVIGS